MDRDGQQKYSGNFEILVVGAHCITGWVDYDATSGAPLPADAVLGGAFTNGTQLYVAWLYDPSMSGYYNVDARIAYAEASGIHARTQMQILVLL